MPLSCKNAPESGELRRTRVGGLQQGVDERLKVTHPRRRIPEGAARDGDEPAVAVHLDRAAVDRQATAPLEVTMPPDVQPAAGTGDFHPAARRQVQNTLSPRQQLSLLVESAVQVDTDDAVAVEDEPGAHASRRTRRLRVRRPRRGVRTRGRTAAHGQRNLPGRVPHPPRTARQLRRHRPGRTMRRHTATARAEASVMSVTGAKVLSAVLATAGVHAPILAGDVTAIHGLTCTDAVVAEA